MIPEPFEHGKHLEMVNRWAVSRGLKAVPVELLPRTGRVVPELAAVFLYKTDSRVGFIEHAITNPDAAVKDASHALDDCIAAIESDARWLGMSVLCGVSRIPGMAERVRRAGFEVSAERFRMMTKGVGKWAL